MLKLFVDTASSIKHEERDKYQVELIPLRYLMGEQEYEDGIGITIDEFYDKLINQKLFPKTSLPYLDKVEERVTKETEAGNDVIIITISSGLSGTYDAIKNLFADNAKVRVVDSLSAVGGIRILVEEVNKYRDKDIDFIVEKINALIPRIRILAIPETLDYLHRGGRLSKKDWILGSLLNIKPIISVKGAVKLEAKKIGIKNAMKFISQALINEKCDEDYHIVPSYTYNDSNLRKLIEMTDEKFHKQMIELDNLDPVLACHWGQNALVYKFVTKG